jgi:hypothetical protein
MEFFNYLNNIKWWGYALIITGGITGLIIAYGIVALYFKCIHKKVYKACFLGFRSVLSRKESIIREKRREIDRMSVSLIKNIFKNEIDEKTKKMVYKSIAEMDSYKKKLEKHSNEINSRFFIHLGGYYAFIKFVSSIKEHFDGEEYSLYILNIPVLRVKKDKLDSSPSARMPIDLIDMKLFIK